MTSKIYASREVTCKKMTDIGSFQLPLPQLHFELQLSNTILALLYATLINLIHFANVRKDSHVIYLQNMHQAQ